MTSSVKVSAHCADTKEVVVVVTTGAAEVVEQYVLQNGEVKDLAIWDDRTVSTFERVKEAAPVAE